MPGKLAAMAATLARDDTIGDTEIEAAIGYVDAKIRMAEEVRAPVPFIAFRTRTILTKALGIRRTGAPSP